MTQEKAVRERQEEGTENNADKTRCIMYTIQRIIYTN
jgi:hypothetical protein